MTGQHNDLVQRLVEELHRRQTHYTISTCEDASELARMNVHGELIGLRAALCIALGHPPEDPEPARDYYAKWMINTPTFNTSRCYCSRCEKNRSSDDG